MERKLQRPLSKDEKRVISYLKKIDKIVGKSDDFNAVLFGHAGYRLYLLLESNKKQKIERTINDSWGTIRKDTIAWVSEDMRGDGGDPYFEEE